MLAQVMARHHGFKSTGVLFAIDQVTGFVDPEVQTNIPGMHHVDTADMIVMLIRFRELPDEDMGRFIDYTFAGKPILALRTSTHAFQYGRDPLGRSSDCASYRPASRMASSRATTSSTVAVSGARCLARPGCPPRPPRVRGHARRTECGDEGSPDPERRRHNLVSHRCV